jgi:hypothetical protein
MTERELERRARPMERWQIDVVGGFHLADGTELKAVSSLATARSIESRCRFIGTHGRISYGLGLRFRCEYAS